MSVTTTVVAMKNKRRISSNTDIAHIYGKLELQHPNDGTKLP